MLTVIEVRLLLCVVDNVVLFTEVLTEVLSIATRSTWIEGLLWPWLTAARAEVRLETIPSKSASQREKKKSDNNRTTDGGHTGYEKLCWTEYP